MDDRSLDFAPLVPIMSLALGAMMVLLAEVLLYPSSKREGEKGGSGGKASGPLLALFSTTALVIAIFFAWRAFGTGVERSFDSLRPMLRADAFSSLGSVVVGVGALLSVWLAATHLSLRRIEHGESQALLLLSTAGMFVLMASSDLVGAYVGVELMSIPLHVLAAFDRRHAKSSEAGLDSVLTGAFASALLLYGMALLYGAAGSTDFAIIAAAPGASSPLAVVGLGLIVAGLVIKLGAAPFHQWILGVYEGSPTSISAFMIVTGTVAIFVTLVRFVALLPGESVSRIVYAFQWLALISMVVSGAMAFVQTELRRVLGYVSLSYAGFALVALSSGTAEALAAALFTLLVFAFAMVGCFSVLVALARDDEACETLDDLAGLADRRSGLAGGLTLFLLALAGVPGTGVFLGKFLIMSTAVESGFTALAIAVAFASLMTAICHVRVVALMYMTAEGDGPQSDEPIELLPPDADEDEPTPEMRSLDVGLLVVCAIAVVYLGLLPTWTTFLGAAQAVAQPASLDVPAELPAAQDADVASTPRDVQLVE